MSHSTETLEQFTNDYVVPVAEAWNTFRQAALTGDNDTGAAYLKYALALKNARAERERLSNVGVFEAERRYEEQARHLGAFENEFIGIRQAINAARGSRQEHRIERESERVADINTRINAYAASIGSQTTRALDDETHLFTLNYIERARTSSFNIPEQYGAPALDSYNEALAHVIEHHNN